MVVDGGADGHSTVEVTRVTKVKQSAFDVPKVLADSSFTEVFNASFQRGPIVPWNTSRLLDEHFKPATHLGIDG